MASHTWGKNKSLALARFWLKNAANTPMPESFFPLVHAVARQLMDAGEYQCACMLLDAEQSMHVERFPAQRAEQVNLLIHARMANGERDKAVVLLERCITHFYLFHTTRALAPFLFMAASHALEKEKAHLLSLCLSLLVHTQAGIHDSTLKRIIRRAGDLKALLRRAGGLDRSTYLRIRLIHLTEHLASLGTPGILMAKGIRLAVPFLMKRRRNDVSTLLPRRLPEKNTGQSGRPIVVTRAMGGIGDLFMMTPGLHALHRKYPERKIIFAIPKVFHPLFETNDDVEVRDVHALNLYREDCSALYNLTECPATQRESATLPNVSQNRIDIFAAAMGVFASDLDRYGRIPRYAVRKEEREWADLFFAEKKLSGIPCIGIQPYAADAYKNYPHMDALINALSKQCAILVFHNKQTPFLKYDHVIDLSGNTLRQNIALLGKVKFLIAVDSAFVHISAAVGTKAFCLYGPTDGRIFTMHYNNCTVIDGYKRTQCRACWRNKDIPCSRSYAAASYCLSAIPVRDILNVCLNS